jgi:hypothetical protein
MDLKVYQLAYALAMEIFCLSKVWPSEEKYSLTDQTRQVGAMLGSMLNDPIPFLIKSFRSISSDL